MRSSPSVPLTLERRRRRASRRLMMGLSWLIAGSPCVNKHLVQLGKD
jgi:hypothetical protein